MPKSAHHSKLGSEHLYKSAKSAQYCLARYEVIHDLESVESENFGKLRFVAPHESISQIFISKTSPNRQFSAQFDIFWRSIKKIQTIIDLSLDR